MARDRRFTLSTTEGDGLWFCLALDGGWTACYRLIPADGRPVVAELRVVPAPPGAVVNIQADGSPLGHYEPPAGGLTAATLRDEVTLAAHVYELLPRALQSSGTSGHDWLSQLFGALGFDPREPRRPRRGPTGWPDADYARLAADYLAFVEAGSRRPVIDLALARNEPEETVRQQLVRARRRGLLTRQTAGKAGGQLTERAKRLLKEEGD